MANACEMCGEVHEKWQAHVFKPRGASNVSQPLATPLATKAETYKYRDQEARREYMRVLMQVKRALASGRACAWPRAS